jgi:AraC family transcriptional regulator
MPRRPPTQADYRARILKAQRWIETHLDEVLEPELLAREASFSLHHFHRIFRGQVGESVMEHVRRLRLERAARRLRADSDARVLDLAIEAGYESHEAFTRCFVQRFGVPPSQFRELPNARVEEWKRSTPSAPRADVRVVSFPELHVASLRHRGGYRGIHELWARMYAWVAARFPRETPALYGVCPDDPEVTAEAKLRFDACAVVPQDFALRSDESDFSMMKIPSGTFAVGTHRGAYMNLSETYLDVIGRWFPTSGYEPAADAVIEHYVNNPNSVAEPDLITEVRVRIADA